MSQVIGRKENVFIVAESTFGTYADPTDGTGSIKHVTCEIKKEQARDIRADHRSFTRSSLEQIAKKVSVTWDIDMYLTPSGTPGTGPDWEMLCNHFFSTPTNSPASAKAVVSSTSTSVVVGGGVGSSFAEKTFLFASTGKQMRFITNIATDTITVTPAWSTNPSAGDSLTIVRNYVLRIEPASPGSVSITKFIGSVMQGCEGAVSDSMEISLSGDGEAKIKFSGAASDTIFSSTDALTTALYAKAELTGTVDGDFVITSSVNDTFIITSDVSGSAQTVTLTAGTRTAAQIAADINSGTTDITASAVGSKVKVQSDTTGTASYLIIGAGTSNTTLGFTTSQAYYANRAYISDASRFSGANETLICGTEQLKCTARDETNNYLTVTRAYNSSVAADHAIAAAISPNEQTASTSGVAVAGVLGEFYLGTGASAVAVKIKSITITVANGAKMLNEHIGEKNAFGFIYGNRTVTFSMKLYLDSAYMDRYSDGENAVNTPIFLQCGENSGSVAGVYMPTTKFNIPSIPSVDAEEVEMDVEGVAIASSAGEDEFYFALA